MNVKLELNADEIRTLIPYQLVCETMNGSKWNTIRRKVMIKEWFTIAERNRFGSMKKQAEYWYLRGLPDKLVITVNNLNLWQKLGLFCSTI